MASSNNANIGFEKQIWDAACVLWGHIPAAEYRKVIVGLIFLRYISSAFEKRYQQLVDEGDGFEDDKDAYAEDNIFFVPEDARWSKIASVAHTPEIGTVIDEAMRAIEKENTTLKNVLPKNYASPDLDKRVLGDVVDLFTNMDMGDTEESKDLLGRTYEYCIQQFAAYEGVKGGEFYTPASIVKTIVAILKPFKNCRVYDPCCGSGGMFVQSAKFIQAHSGKRGEIAVYGQESNADTWKMAKMNMAIRGIDADFGAYQADTFFNDLHKTLKADFIMANPPFNLSNWGQEKLKEDVRWKYGTPPAGNANYAWIQHMIHHLAPNGKISLVVREKSERILFRLTLWKASSLCRLSSFTALPFLLRFGLLPRTKSKKAKPCLLTPARWGIWLTVSTEILLMRIFKSLQIHLRHSKKVRLKMSKASVLPATFRKSKSRTSF